MQTYEILLISQSPRRRQILGDAGLKFTVDTVKVSEFIDKNVNPMDAVSAVAKEKLDAYLNHHKVLKLKDILLISADTVVVLGDKILGKPENSGQAVEFLRALSDQTHSVMTAVCVYNSNTHETLSFVETTKVEFLKISDQQIQSYVESGEPMDKAGAYAIQGGGGKFVKKTEGDYLNVVGLPLKRLQSELAKKDWHVARG